MTNPEESLILDLLPRVEMATTEIMHIVDDTKITMDIGEIVAKVERGLPANYWRDNSPGYPLDTRRLIERMARDIISGEAYE